MVEENPNATSGNAAGEPSGLNSVGVRPDLDSGGDFDFNTDDEPGDDADAEDTGESPISGDEADTDTGDET